MGNRASVDRYGMPYAIAPAEPPQGNPDLRPTEHHAFYRSRAPELATGLGRALRISRVHILPAWLHNTYHRQFRDGLADFPQNDVDTFGLLILSCAGYLSQQGWHRSPSGTLELKTMSFGDYQQVRSRHLLHAQTETNSRLPTDGSVYRRTKDVAIKEISEAINEYARCQKLDHIKDADFVDEFLNTKNVIRRYELGRRILREATIVAVDPVRPIYHEALSEGLIRNPEPDPLRVVTRFPIAGRWEEHEEVLIQQLAA